MILGVDVSTSITGFAIISEDGDVVELSYCDLRKYKTFFGKCLKMREFTLNLIEKYSGKIKHMYIEQPFTFFNSGGSSAKTMASLQRFNGVTSWMLYEALEMTPEYIGATQARKKIGIKVPRGEKAKVYVLNHLRENEQFEVETTRHGNPKPQYYDMADALVIARAGLIIEKENIS
jgi:Holliday junction resolvasome RuvABC endonuclease subunit|tara:strand:+ start:306 stop:833 length:528 start_codon:yes stop_codon:yes gene_type:complete